MSCISQVNILEPHSFSYLLHKVANLSGCSIHSNSKADVAVRMLIEVTKQIDDSVDNINSKNAQKEIPLLVITSNKTTELIENGFERKQFKQICKLNEKYLQDLMKLFEDEKMMKSEIKTTKKITGDALLKLQENRNVDLLFFYNAYASLVQIPKKFRMPTLERIKWFGAVDLTIDDYLDLDEDLRNQSFNVFLVMLCKKLGIKSYPKKMSYEEISSLLYKKGIYEEVLKIINPTRRKWFTNLLPITINEYFQEITEDRFYLLERTLLN